MKLPISINLGVLEYWSVGVMVKGLIFIFSILHYSRFEISGIFDKLNIDLFIDIVPAL